LRSTVSVFVPPWKVGVAAITAPLVPCWRVKLWPSGESLVNVIVIFPALAVSVFLVNISMPLGLAAIERELEAPAAAVLDAVAVAVLDAVAVAEELGALEAADEVLLLLLLLEPPQAVKPSTTIAVMRANAGNLRMLRLLC
jgi:hypothetical protein